MSTASSLRPARRAGPGHATDDRRRRSRPRATLAGLTAVALLVGACGNAPGNATGDDRASGGTATPEGALDGTWHLVAGEGPDGAILPLPEDDERQLEITLVVDGSRWRGQICNIYDTQATINDGTVQLAPISHTEMGCPDPLVTQAETRYLDALPRVETIDHADDELTLRGRDVVLTYARERAEPETVPLTGTVWRVTSLSDGEVARSPVPAPTSPDPDTPVSDAPVTLPDELPRELPLFLIRNGSFELTTGCRRITGTIALHADELELDGTEVETADDCGGTRDQDTHLAATVLDGPVRFTLDGDRLTLGAQERTVELQPATDPPT